MSSFLFMVSQPVRSFTVLASGALEADWYGAAIAYVRGLIIERLWKDYS
jgi:hypothetical protein